MAKSTTPEKKEAKSSAGGGLFSDEGEDLFTSSQSSSVSSNKPTAGIYMYGSTSVFKICMVG